MEKKKRIYLILGIILTIVMMVGASYAYWRLNLPQITRNIVNTGCLKMEFTDKNAINLSSAIPIIDETGKTLVPYEFTLKNVCENNEVFDITLEILNESTLKDLDYIKIMLDEKDPELLNTKSKVEPTLTEATDSYFLKSGYLAGKESKSYKLRLWMDQDTPTDDKYMEKMLSSKIVIVSSIYEKEIDKTPPIANFVTTEVSGGYLVDARTSTDDSSGISTYYYSKDGVNWITSKEDNYVFRDDATLTNGKATDVIRSIAEQKVYDIYVKVEDNFENMSEVVKKNVKAKELEYDHTIDNNLRYVGLNPSNYVTYNNELWRIIGVMNHIIDADGNQDSLIKLVRNQSIGNYAWDSGRKKFWDVAPLKNTLNVTYFNGIPQNYQNMVKEVIWNLSVISMDIYGNTGNATPSKFYQLERGKIPYENNDVTWLGKLALMYPSDYGFAVGGGSSNRSKCLNKKFSEWEYGTCHTNNWLHKSDIRFLTPALQEAYIYNYETFPNGNLTVANGDDLGLTYPTFYLKSNVNITSGKGTTSEPFHLELEET